MSNPSKITYWIKENEFNDIATSGYWNDEELEKKKTGMLKIKMTSKQKII